MTLKDPKKITDEVTGLPYLSNVYSIIERELNNKGEVGFLYFDILQFRQLEEQHGFHKCQEVLRLLGKTLRRQKGYLYRDEDLVVVGGKGLDYFVLFLFSPPRRKGCFTSHDLKLISTRIKQKLKHVLDEHSDELGIDQDFDFHTGYTILKKDPFMQVERLIYEARKEAGFKSHLEDIMVQFISNISHELRTPLTSIKGYTETLLEGAMDDRELCQRWLHIIYDEARRLERLIKDMLDLSMLEAEQVELQFGEVEISKIVNDTINILMPVAKKENVNLVASFTETLPAVIVDEDRIKQVLLNLIHNAIKYSPKDGSVTITAVKMDREVKVLVSDQGCGIAPKHLVRIFERFYRVDNDRAKKSGRGLGLSIARHIVEAHGGIIGVDSEKNKGTVFFFTIPTDTVFPIDQEI